MKILIVDDMQGWVNYHKSIVLNLFTNLEIVEANSAKEGYDKLLEYNEKPFDIILTDMQMEEDFEPKYAGEWFIEQVKTFKNYSKSKIVIISAAYNIEHIAKIHNVNFIRKQTARNFPDSYNFLVDL